MKRRMTDEAGAFVAEGVSQASVPGAEQACTAIAVVACADVLTAPERRLSMAQWIRRGAALYAAWRRPDGPAMAFAKEVVDLVSPALPVCCGDEWGGLRHDLADALAVLGDDDGAAVLTCGAVSLALFEGGTGLFDSHPQPEHGGGAVLGRFPSRADTVAYLLARFAAPGMEFSLCVVRRRLFHPPRVFPVQELAFRHADRLPPGFYYVYARDVARSGAKEYLVAGLDDFFAHYQNRSPAQRTHYDLARTGRPVTLYVDLEFEGYEQNAHCDGPQMLQAMLALIAEAWREETAGEAIPVDTFCVFDASSAAVRDPEPMRCSSSSSDEGGEEGEGGGGGGGELPKVSYHVHHQGMRFADAAQLGRFMERVEQRAAGGNLMVWRKVWDASAKEHVMEQRFFADLSVYSANRCFRLPFSTKLGRNRPLLPVGEMGLRDALLGAILSPPDLLAEPPLVPAPASAPEEEEEEEGEPPGGGGGGGGLVPLDRAPAALRALGDAVEAHFRPERMRGFQLTPTGEVVYSMVKHDCEICHDTHNNQVYAVADLKRRVFYQKCHADRSKSGAEVPFPASLGSLSLANAGEMQPGERAILGIFRAASSTARMVLGFAGAIYAKARSAPVLPLPGTADVHYDKVAQRYEVTLPGACALDGGVQVLQVTLSKLVLRCKGKRCAARGKRWDRPSHSAVTGAAGAWVLSFLFPDAQMVVADAAAFPPALLGPTPEAFLAEPNLVRALGFGDGGAPPHMYEDRLKQLDDWAALRQREAGSTVDELARRVRAKCRVAGKILGDELLEACYRECLAVADDFAYPVELVPRGASTLASSLWIHLGRTRGYKRSEDAFYLPHTDDQGRSFYRTVSMEAMLTSVCTYDRAPNLCSAVMWSGRVCDDLRRVLCDPNQFPSLPISKRYLGYANAVYDLERNEALTWEAVRRDPAIMPFNFIDQQFPIEALAQAKAACPTVRVGDDPETGKPTVLFESVDAGGAPAAAAAALHEFVPTPFFDGPLLDQEFSPAMILWLCALLGRLFHYVGKGGESGDNWEIVPFLIGVRSSFKSSIIALVRKFLQEDQVGVIGTQVESAFPLDGVPGKLLGVMSECGGCTLDRDLYKLLASGDPVRVHGKHRTAINVPSWVIPLLMGGNAFMDMRDTDGSVERRSAVFPFRCALRDGKGDTDLTDRIFAQEGPLLLIKWNTLYLAMRAALRTRVQPLLPPLVREATRQAIMKHDSFKAFMALEYVVSRGHRLPWSGVWARYGAWCKAAQRAAYQVDPLSTEAQALFHDMGVRLSRSRGPLHLVHLRLRTAADPPFRSIFGVREVRRRRAADQNGEEEEEEAPASSGTSSSEAE